MSKEFNLFPFPSNGKVCSKTGTAYRKESKQVTSFHSLQTGKYVASGIATDAALRGKVSIPFKRESM